MVELPFNPCQLIMSQMKIWDISDSSKWEALKSSYGIVLHWYHLQIVQALVVRNTDMLELSNITVWNHAVIWLTPTIDDTMKQNLMSISANALRSCLMSNNCEILFEKIHENVTKFTSFQIMMIQAGAYNRTYSSAMPVRISAVDVWIVPMFELCTSALFKHWP